MRRTMVLALGVALSGCGGGGSTAPAAPTAEAAYNLDAAITNALTKGASLTTRAQVNGTGYTLLQRFQPVPDGSPTGAPPLYHMNLETVTLMSGSTVVGGEGAMLYFTTGPAAIVYSTTNNEISRYTQTAPLPTAATAGQSGPWNTAQLVSTITNAAMGTQTTAWSLEPDGPSTAWACLNFTTTGTSPSTEKDCYRIDPAGNVSGGKFTLTVNGQTITFQ